jgi:hypothetical protein
MRRDELEHVIGAAANITGEDEFVVIGSQAILASYPSAPPELLISMEADVYPRQHPEKADDIDGTIGDGSQFHVTFGYYAHGVGPETAKAPAGWQRASGPHRRSAARWLVAPRRWRGVLRSTISSWPNSRPAGRETANSPAMRSPPVSYNYGHFASESSTSRCAARTGSTSPVCWRR